jgi:hypothetical protein
MIVGFPKELPSFNMGALWASHGHEREVAIEDLEARWTQGGTLSGNPIPTAKSLPE